VQLEALSATSLRFSLEEVTVMRDAADVVSVSAVGAASRNILGEPEVPVVRRAVVLPNGATKVSAKLTNAEIESFPLHQWGKVIAPSKGLQSLCCANNVSISLRSSEAYAGQYPRGGVAASASLQRWRDVQGAIVEINPIAVDHSLGVVQVLRSGLVEIASDAMGTSPSSPAVIDREFMAAYSSVYSNWQHVAGQFMPADSAGRVLVVYDAKFAAQATKYAGLVQQRFGNAPLMYEAPSSSSEIQSKIRSYFEEEESLSYLTIIGREVPTMRGSKTGGKECDHCYAMLSGGVSLDIFVGRLSGSTVADIERQLTKIAQYEQYSKGAWVRQAFGIAFNLAGDEYQTMTDIMGNLGDAGFSKHDWVHGSSTQGSQVFKQMNEGLGVFSYLGHGQGDAWDTPMMTEEEIQELTNKEMPFFEIDVSCDNGAFQTYSPCMGEALLTASGGAIATMMHAPEARGTMCKHYMVQASVALREGKVTQVGSVYTTALMAAHSMDPDEYAVQGYNTFGDPTLKLPFVASSMFVV
jgi:hypothetical protein